MPESTCDCGVRLQVHADPGATIRYGGWEYRQRPASRLHETGLPMTLPLVYDMRSRRAARRVIAASLAAAVPLACAACSTAPAARTATAASPVAASHSAAPDQVAVTGAVVVEPVAAGDPANLVFTVVNGTGTADGITGVSSRISASIALNNTLTTGSSTDPITLAPHSTVQLSAVGPDVWVFNPALLHAGSAVPVTVHFQHAAPVTLDAAVRTAMQMAQTATAAPGAG
jgi:copper(I)-binding protein